VWACFAGCIVLIPVPAALGRFPLAAALLAVTLVEVLAIVLNVGSCPLTRIAARYASDRRANVDIYLPEWRARQNKRLFGALYAGSVMLTAYLWRAHGAA